MTPLRDIFVGSWSWLQAGGNSNIVLVVITAVYVFLTHRIMKATRLQAEATLQPSLNIGRLTKPGEHDRFVYVENRGNQPVIILDLTIEAKPSDRKVIVRRMSGYDDQLLSKDMDIDYSLPSHLDVRDDECGFAVLLTVSDMSRQVVVEYQFYPVIGHLHCRQGVPFRVRLRRIARPLKSRYFRVRYWAEGRFRNRKGT